MKAIRYSGIRLDATSYTWKAQLDGISQNALNYGQEILSESMKEPYLYGDGIKSNSLLILVQNILSNGELFFAVEDDKPIGYAAFYSVTAGQKAMLEIYILPEYRKTAVLADFREILYDAAFKPFPDGLQLHKVCARVHPDNQSSLTACKNSGFTEIARLKFEGLYAGAQTDMIYLELFPRELTELVKPVEIEKNGRTKRAGKTDPIPKRDVRKQHSPRTGRKSAQLSSDRTESIL